MITSIEKLYYRQTGSFSKTALDYIENAESIRPFYTYAPHYDSVEAVVKNIDQYSYDRNVLADVFHRQYKQAGITPADAVLTNINALSRPNTYAVVTGHQPCLLGGPLYFIYKIAAAVNLANSLNQRFSAYHFVPVYWVGSEDHDFEEINHIHLFGRTLSWQSGQKGATGRMATDNLQPLLADIKTMLGTGEQAQRIMNLLEMAYRPTDNTLGKATRYLVNALFEKYGLLVLDQDDAALKQLFLPVMQREAAQMPSHTVVSRTNQALETNGYPPQAFVRDINLFYLDDERRERIIVHNDQSMSVQNMSLTWSNKAEMLQFMTQNPHRFSPNVILRPLYQQTILPTVAYIGGGGELAYWLQLRDLFTHFGIHYPMLCLRNSAVNIDANTAQKIHALHLTNKDLFENSDKLMVQYVANNTANELDLTAEKEALNTIFTQIEQKAFRIDPTLQTTVAGEMSKAQKSLEALEAKLLRAEKRNFDTDMARIKAVKDKLFPNDGQLQERYDNFLPYYLKYGDAFIDTLTTVLNPIEEQQFLCLYWEETNSL